MDGIAVVVTAVVLSLVAGALACPSAVGRRADRLLRWARGLPGRARERTRLRIAAALLDLGNHLMLCREERRARRLEKRLSGRRARRVGLQAAALRLGAARADEVTLELPIGSREQEGNPSRTLALSCVVHHPPPEGPRRPRTDESTRAWRVVNRPSPGYRGPSTTSEMPSLDRALLAYHARPLRLSPGPRFLDEGVHDGARRPSTAGPSAVPEGRVPDDRVHPAAKKPPAGRTQP